MRSNNIRTFADLNNKSNNKDKKQKNKSTMANDGYDNKIKFSKVDVPVRGFSFASGKQVWVGKDYLIYCADHVKGNAVGTRPCFGSQPDFDDTEVIGKYPLCPAEKYGEKGVPPKETNPIEDYEYRTPEARDFARKLKRQKHINRVVEYIGGDWKTRLADQKNGDNKHKYIVSNVNKTLEYRRNDKSGHCYITHDVKEMIGPECMENFLKNEKLLNNGTPYKKFIEKVMEGIDINNPELRRLKKTALMEFLEKNGFRAEYEELVKNQKGPMDSVRKKNNHINNSTSTLTDESKSTGIDSNLGNSGYSIINQVNANSYSSNNSYEDYLWPNNYNNNNFNYYGWLGSELGNYYILDTNQAPGIQYDYEDSSCSFSSKPNNNSYYTQTYTPQQISNNISCNTYSNYPYIYNFNK